MRHDTTLEALAFDAAALGRETHALRDAGPAPCQNEGCSRPAAAGETLCETCGIEQTLFRRDRRPPIPGARRAER